MRVKSYLVFLSLALMLIIPQLVIAGTAVHSFECKDCHLQGYSFTELGGANVCLQCHTDGGIVATSDQFASGDASNHYGNGTGLVNSEETSHNWSASSTNPAAGAVEPARYANGFTSRYGATAGKVACSRCHNPHAEVETNPKLLAHNGDYVTPMKVNDMCLACHKTFDDNSDPVDHGLLSHPMVGTYDGTAPGYKTVGPNYDSTSPPANPYANGIQLVDGGVSCLSCHNLHYTDSDSGTADGPDGAPIDGDGLLLRGDGTQFVNDAAKATSFCTTCHDLDPAATIHGSASVDMGCMGCHGGHNYNGNDPSYYMLIDNYKVLPSEVTGEPTDPSRSDIWGGMQLGVVDGFCETCHGDIGNTTILPHMNENRVHIQGEDCSSCHGTTHDAGAFSNPTGCDGCHGSPPVKGFDEKPGGGGPDGYANDGGAFSYYNAAAYKDESFTPHGTHALSVSNGGYGFSCNACHNARNTTDGTIETHQKGSFQDVMNSAVLYLPITDAGGTLNPDYLESGVGTCSATYCHSTGGENISDDATISARDYSPVVLNNDNLKSAVWDNGKGTITTCNACHGNTATTMASATHDKHLAGYSCNICHYDTASSNNALTATAIGGTHVNGTLNVKFDTTNPLKSGGAVVAHDSPAYPNPDTMTCSVYCHSTGQSDPSARDFKPVSWTDSGIGCTSCHNLSDPISGQTAAHDAHVYGATNSSNVGRDLDCATCHDATMNAGDNATIADASFHVNGKVDVLLPTGLDATTSCGTGIASALCHSDGNFDSVETGDRGVQFNVPAWTLADTTPGTLDNCVNCHGDGASIAYPAYANKGTLVVDGTGDSNSHEPHVGGGITCDECHATTSSDGSTITGVTHVNQTVDVSGTQITSYDEPNETCVSACHGGNQGPNNPKWGGAVVCGTCHAANNQLADSHPMHYNTATTGKYNVATIGSTSTEYVFQCGVCHTSDGTPDVDAIRHAGGWVDTTPGSRVTAQVYFNSTIVSSGSYARGAGETLDNTFYYSDATCNSLYCHGNFGGNGNNDTIATPTWGSAASGACGTCHDVDTSPTMDGGSHNTHVKDVGIDCDFCHGVTAVNKDGGIDNRALHVNQFLNWELNASKDQLTASSTYDGANSGTRAAAVVGISGNYASCASVYCHSDVQAVPPKADLEGVTFSSPAPKWGGSAPCGSCHKGETPTVEIDTASHTKHVASTSYAMACSTCHEGAGSNTPKHADYRVDLKINTDWGGSYDGTPAPGDAYGTCSANYCHSQGTDGTTPFEAAPNTAPTWNTSLGCSDCHSSTAITSNAHDNHLDSNQGSVGTATSCETCHFATATGNTVVKTLANHTNKLTNVKFDNVKNKNTDATVGPTYSSNATTGANGATKPAGDAIGSCDNLYCHSVGNLDATGSVIAVGSPAVDFIAVAWDDATGLDCADCHGDGNTKAYPVYENGGVGSTTANSHDKHVGGGTLCSTCHETTTTSASIDPATMTVVLPGSGGTHLDREETVSFNNAIAGGSAGYAPLTKTCSTVDCHGSGAPQWGGTVDCASCHVGATDVDDFEKNDTAAVIAKSEWNTVGHGKNTTVFNSVSLGGNDPCLWCHDAGEPHESLAYDDASASNIFRLRGDDYNSAAFGWNGACLVCHDSNALAAGYNAEGAMVGYELNLATVPKVDKWHQMNAHALANDNGGQFCWDCHDPHGDDANIMMIQAKAAVQTDGTHGLPEVLSPGVYNTVGAPIVFTNNTVAVGDGGFAVDTATKGSGIEYDAGICNACHTASASNPKMAHYTSTSSDDHNNGKVCTDCHKHNADTVNDGFAFAGSGCNGCHGGSGDGSTNNFWPDDAGAYDSASENSAGRHLKHIDELSQSKYGYDSTVLMTKPDSDQIALCEYCHDAPGADADHGNPANLPAETSPFYGMWETPGTDTPSGAYDSYYPGTGNDTCSSVACHNNQDTSDAAQYGWYGSSVADGTVRCSNCHTTGTADAGNNQHPNSGLHKTTVAGVKQHTDYSCTLCHATATAATHIDGTAEVDSDNNSAQSRFLIAADTGWADGSDAGTPATCGSTTGLISGCHSDDGNWKRQWSTAADSAATLIGSARCNVCHGQPVDATVGDGAGDGWRTGLTVDHNLGGINNTGNHAVCETCHVAPTSPYVFVTHHTDGSGDAGGNGTIEYNNNVDINYDTTTANCTNACHDKTMSSTSTLFLENGLGGKGVDCSSCHYAVGGSAGGFTIGSYTFVGDNSGSQRHPSHVYTAATAYNSAATNTTDDVTGYDFSCAHCHGKNQANHVNGSLEVTIGSWTGGGSDTCGTSACHNNGAGGAAEQTVGWYSGYAGNDKCAICHLNTPDTNAHGDHEVSIHNADIYTGTTGLVTDNDGVVSAHGSAANSTTVSCYTCHSATVTDNFNDQSSSCSSCHVSGGAVARGNLEVNFKSKHVDGNVDVVFATMANTFNSRAQLRNDLSSAPTVDGAWTRSAGDYKVDATSFDTAKTTPTLPNFTADKTCSTTACHNGIETPAWNIASGSKGNCMACHTELPQ